MFFYLVVNDFLFVSVRLRVPFFPRCKIVKYPDIRSFCVLKKRKITKPYSNIYFATLPY